MAGWHRWEDCPQLTTPVVVKGMRLPGVSVLLEVAQWWVVAQWEGTVAQWWVVAQWEGGKDAARSRLPS